MPTTPRLLAREPWHQAWIKNRGSHTFLLKRNKHQSLTSSHPGLKGKLQQQHLEPQNSLKMQYRLRAIPIPACKLAKPQEEYALWCLIQYWRYELVYTSYSRHMSFLLGSTYKRTNLGRRTVHKWLQRPLFHCPSQSLHIFASWIVLVLILQHRW